MPSICSIIGHLAVNGYPQTYIRGEAEGVFYWENEDSISTGAAVNWFPTIPVLLPIPNPTPSHPQTASSTNLPAPAWTQGTAATHVGPLVISS